MSFIEVLGGEVLSQLKKRGITVSCPHSNNPDSFKDVRAITTGRGHHMNLASEKGTIFPFRKIYFAFLLAIKDSFPLVMDLIRPEGEIHSTDNQGRSSPDTTATRSS